MKDHLKTKAELIEELESLRRRIAEGSPSERATIEISLEDSERRYLSLVDQSPIAYEVYDSEGLQLKVNRAYEDMWGMKAEDSEGIFNVRTDPQVELLGLKPYVERAFTGESVKLPVFAWDPGKSGFPGRARWLSTRIYPLKDKSDNILNVVITHEDITESKLAEEARSLSEQRYRDLFSQANEGLLIMTLEGQLSELNKSFAEMHGYTVEELKNRDISELDVLQENAISSRADLIDHILAGNVARFEVEHYHKNGHIFPLSVTVSLVRIGDEQFFMSFHQDITERKQAEEKIKSTKLLLRSSLESQKDTIIFSIDKNYHYLFFNKAHREVMKSVYNKDVVIGMNILECITSDDDRQAAKEYYDRALTGETHSNIQEYGIEERSYFESFFNPMLNDKNEIVGATALARDITERKRAEEQIREKDIQFRKLSANLPDLIFQFTRRPDGSYYVPIASEGIKNIFGCSPEDVLEDFTPIGNVIYPEDAERVINDIEYSAKHLTYFTCEFRVQIPGKPIQWIYSRSSPEKLADGSVTWYGFNADITERKRAENAIQESRERVAALADASTEAIFFSEKGVCVDQNLMAKKMFGYSKKEAVGKMGTDWIIPEHRDLVMQNILLGFEGPYEVDALRKDGSTFHAEIRAGMSQYMGRDVRTTALRDITKRKQAEQERAALEVQLRQSQKLEAIGTMVGGISHEFNNVLQSMFLYGGLVQDTLPENEELRLNFQHILDDGNRARDLIKQILTFSRMAKIDMRPRPLHEMVIEVLVLERASLPANIDIQQDIDMNCGLVLCDKTQIHQIIMNLCNNAQHAMADHGGTLTVSLKPTRASLDYSDLETDALELKVSDTGHGIDTADLERIFDPFFTTKQFGEGTGLGLSVIHGIVEMMEGQILVTSNVGEGSTFRILLPLTAEVEKNVLVEAVGQTALVGRSILLVDDDDAIRDVTQFVLIHEGNFVDSAADGAQALGLFMANPEKYDLIVTDQSMPKMSGVELTKAIRRTNTEIPIILSTGQLGIENNEEFRNIGISGFIQKPWTANELIERIQEL